MMDGAPIAMPNGRPPAPTENRTPRPKACTFCRSSKHRCDGQEGVYPCSRCVRNLRKCTWPERKQMGRKPKNLKRTASQADIGAGQEEIPAFAQASYPSVPASTTSSDPFVSPAPNWGLEDLSPSLLGPGGLTINLNELPVPSAQDPPLAEVITPMLERTTSNSATSSASESSPFPMERISFPPNIQDPETAMKLLDIFYAIPHHYVPILLPKDEFLSNIGQQGTLLLDSIFALASSYASFPVRQDYRDSAVSRLNSIESDQMDPFSSDSIQYMQSLLILVYLEFGNANIPFACQLMNRACHFAQKQGWNALDVAEGNEGTEFTVNRDGPLVRRGVTGGPPLAHDDLRRRIRIIWWECWACDIVMSVTCRQPRNFHGVTVNVSLPSTPAVFREPGCPVVWYYPLRVRALTILVEAIGFPACQDEAQRQQNAEQFFTFDTLIDNLMMEANLAWADCVKVVTGYSGQLNTTPLGIQAAIGKELFFMTVLMLHAASIHLHHLYAMPEVNFDLKVCGITTGFQLLELQQTNASDDYSENVFRPSLGKIVTSSRALMGLMRSAYKTSIFAMTQHTLPSTGISAHIPKVDIPSVDEPLAVTEDILHHSPFCGCSQVVAAFGAALEVATATSKWQAMAAESNFETSKMVLQRLKRVWPVAAVFEDELEKCHGAVQSALQLW